MMYGSKYPKGTAPVYTGGKGINVKESRLNSGSDMAYKGKRGSVKGTK